MEGDEEEVEGREEEARRASCGAATRAGCWNESRDSSLVTLIFSLGSERRASRGRGSEQRFARLTTTTPHPTNMGAQGSKPDVELSPGEQTFFSQRDPVAVRPFPILPSLPPTSLVPHAFESHRSYSMLTFFPTVLRGPRLEASRAIPPFVCRPFLPSRSPRRPYPTKDRFRARPAARAGAPGPGRD